MYRYDEFDARFVAERAGQFRSQVAARVSGALTEEEFRPLRLMNGLYLQLHAYMLRIAIPYGTMRGDQMRMLAHIAEKYDRGYGHFTTRQNIQFNWPKLRDAPDILDALATVEMHAIQTSGNCIRNTTSDPFAGVAPDEIEDPRPTAELIRQWSSLHPEFTFLGRKFKIAVIGAEADRAALKVHDIGIRIVRNEAGEIGYQVFVGGGLGRTPMIAKEVRAFLPKAELLPYLEACLRVYNLFGRRDNKYKARIKILVHEIGVEEYRRLVEEEFAAMNGETIAPDDAEVARIATYFAPPVYEALAEESVLLERMKREDAEFAAWVRRNVHPHKAPGYAAATISLKPIGGAPGDATAEQMRAIAEIAEKYSLDELRVTHEQNIVLPHLRKDQLYTVWRALAAQGLEAPNPGLVTDIIACPGLDYCSLATARSIPVAQRIAERFSDPALQEKIGPLSIKISGCIDACGHHHIGHIGILGLDKAGIESYQITLGGDPTETAAIGERTGPGFSYEDVVGAIDTLIAAYLDKRLEGETFLQCYRRLGMASFKETSMPLRDDTGPIDDQWTRIAPGEPLAARALLDLEEAEARADELAGRTPETLGVHLPNNAPRERIAPWLEKAGLISVAFPSFSDGRGFSLARTIRSMGYAGRLRASGPVIADQYAYLRAVGFDEVDVPEAMAARQPEVLWAEAAARMSVSYQRGYAGPRNILEARRAARAE